MVLGCVFLQNLYLRLTNVGVEGEGGDIFLGFNPDYPFKVVLHMRLTDEWGRAF